MAFETPASTLTSQTETSTPAMPATGNMVAIDTPLGRPARLPSKKQMREDEEDLARLQDQLMEVLEENQQLRVEVETWRAGARAIAGQNRAS